MLRIAPYLYLPITDMPGDFEVMWYVVFMCTKLFGLLRTPTVGAALALALATQREHGNSEDAYAVAVTQRLPHSNYERQF